MMPMELGPSPGLQHHCEDSHGNPEMQSVEGDVMPSISMSGRPSVA